MDTGVVFSEKRLKRNLQKGREGDIVVFESGHEGDRWRGPGSLVEKGSHLQRTKDRMKHLKIGNTVWIL